MDCCICHNEWTLEEYEELSDDEKAQTNTCKECNAFVCIMCRYEWENTLDNKSKRFECPICRTMDWKHYFEEDILWYIKHHSIDCCSISDYIYSKYLDETDNPPPILKITDKYMNTNAMISQEEIDDFNKELKKRE